MCHAHRVHGEKEPPEIVSSVWLYITPLFYFVHNIGVVCVRGFSFNLHFTSTCPGIAAANKGIFILRLTAVLFLFFFCRVNGEVVHKLVLRVCKRFVKWTRV